MSVTEMKKIIQSVSLREVIINEEYAISRFRGKGRDSRAVVAETGFDEPLQVGIRSKIIYLIKGVLSGGALSLAG